MKGDNAGLCGVADTIANRRSTGSVAPSPEAGASTARISSGNEIWDPGTTTDRVTFVIGKMESTTAINMINYFNYQGGLYAGCTRYPPDGNPALPERPRGHYVQRDLRLRARG